MEIICVKYYCVWKIEIEEYERIEKDLIKTNAFVFLYKSEMTVVVL
jgi:cell fate regulator YaaT (PSP1 superfamily)